MSSELSAECSGVGQWSSSLKVAVTAGGFGQLGKKDKVPFSRSLEDKTPNLVIHFLWHSVLIFELLLITLTKWLYL